MLDSESLYDPCDLPVLTIRVVRDFEMDEYQGKRHSVLWLTRSHTTLAVELMTPCHRKEGARLMGQWVQQAVKAHMNNGTAFEATDDKLMEEFPAIFDFLTCNIGEGGKPRAVGSLTLFARTGGWHACLKDRQTKKSWWGEGDTLGAAMKALDSALQGA